MGWRELCGYVAEMNRAKEQKRARAESWEHAEHDPAWREMWQKRERYYGRR